MVAYGNGLNRSSTMMKLCSFVAFVVIPRFPSVFVDNRVGFVTTRGSSRIQYVCLKIGDGYVTELRGTGLSLTADP